MGDRIRMNAKMPNWKNKGKCNARYSGLLIEILLYIKKQNFFTKKIKKVLTEQVFFGTLTHALTKKLFLVQ